jgi:hypothetical protein
VEVLQAHAAFYRVHEQQWTAREWPRMLRRGHLLRLRVAREQFGAGSRLAKWMARFYSARMARAYAQRFEMASATLRRTQALGRIPFSGISSGWVWAALKAVTRSTSASRSPGHEPLYDDARDNALPASSEP